MKKHSHNVRVEMLEILLSLKIKDINLDHDKELELKEKKLQSHKQNILQLSKKEKKVRIHHINLKYMNFSYTFGNHL